MIAPANHAQLGDVEAGLAKRLDRIFGADVAGEGGNSDSGAHSGPDFERLHG